MKARHSLLDHTESPADSFSQSVQHRTGTKTPDKQLGRIVPHHQSLEFSTRNEERHIFIHRKQFPVVKTSYAVRGWGRREKETYNLEKVRLLQGLQWNPPHLWFTRLVQIDLIELEMMAGGVCSASWCTGIIIASLALFQVSAVRSNPVCAWDEYYDENMENCGPCREICVNMKVTRTERQCQKQCSG